MLPEQFRTRSFDVAVRSSPNGEGRFVVDIQTGDLLAGYTRFDAGVAGNHFAAMVGDSHGTPGIAERIAANTFLGFDGVAAASLSSDAASVTGLFDGVISVCELPAAPGSYYSCAAATTRAVCTSPRHQFVLQSRTDGFHSR
jgi:hypothetical protein